jgi:hypothetical protein
VRIAAAVCAAALACGDAQEPASEPAPAPTETPAPAPPEPAHAPAPAPPAAAPAPAPAPAPPPSREPPQAETSAPAQPAPPAEPEAPAISLEELAQRIKETDAIGTFSKLALKNDIDDLVDDLRRYHQNQQGDLDALHARYDALVLKLMTLLEQDEPDLALALGRSRKAIWGKLVNPVEFAKLPA